MPDTAEIEREYARLIQDEDDARAAWVDIQENHPSKGTYWNARRATDRFLDLHPEIQRPEVVDDNAKDARIVMLSNELEAQRLANQTLRDELAAAVHELTEQNLQRYGD